MASTCADHDLLFEALAVHLGFVARDAIGEARKDEDPDGPGDVPLAEILTKRGGLSAEHAAVLDLLATDMLARHDGNLRQCLNSLTAFGRLRHELERRLAGLESCNPTVPPGVLSGRARAKHEAPGSNGEHEHGPGEAASGPSEAKSGPAGDRADAAEDADDNDEAAEADGQEYEWSLTAPNALGNRYQILHSHARGGIGVVSVAFDSELQREVALKQIKADSADDPDSRSRFLLEAEVTGRLEHPGIVPVYGLGYDDQGRPYYAMRFVRGITLEEAITKFHAGTAGHAGDPRERALELRQLLGRFVNVCHTVAYAHSRGVLHRDLKPANVLLGPYNETLIVDWGLAKVLRRGQEPGDLPAVERSDELQPRSVPRPGRIVSPLGQSSSTETVAGSAFGTPAFMSPEQAEGQLDRLSPASDVYSLGAVLYTLLCGRPPFESAWCEVTTLLARVKNSEFPPPRQVNPRVPRPLEAICLRAMGKAPENRYLSADELALDIERWLGDEPVHAYREPRWARILRWGRRHRPLVASAGVLLLTAVAGLTLGIILLGRAQRETEAQRLRAVQERELATLMSGQANERADSLRRRDYISRVNLANREFLDDNAGLAEQLLYGCPSNLRNWEWSHVQRLAHLELDTFVSADIPQAQDIWSLAFSPDGRRLVSGSGPWYLPQAEATATLVVREVDSGREIFKRRGGKGAVQAVAFSPDGKRVVAGTGTTGGVTGAELSCHDAATGEPLWHAEEHDINILSLAYSPDGKTIASGCGGFNNYAAIGYARLRDAATGKTISQIPGGPGGVASVAFSPDGKQLALASRGMVDVWDLSSHAIAHQLRGHKEFVYAVAFSPDGRWIASAGWDKAIRLWDRTSGALVRTLLGSRGFVRGLSFRPDSKQIISCSEDRGLRLWDVASGRSLASFHGHTGFIHCVAFSPDGAQAASGGMDGSIKLWPAAAPDTQVIFSNGSGWVGTVAFHPDGHRVATAHNGDIRVWDPRTGEEFWRIVGPRILLGRIALCFSPDGQFLIASAPDGAINLWNADTGALARKLTTSHAAIGDADLSPDGSLLARADGDSAVVVSSLTGGTPPRTLTGHAAAVNAVAFSGDGLRLASASEDRMIKIWNVGSGSELMNLRGHLTGVKDLAFSPDGRFLASVGGQYRGTPGSEVFIWDSFTGRLLRKLEGHTGLVNAVAYFPDGTRLATASDDRTIKLWDSRTGDDVFTLRGHTSGVVSLAISRDGHQVVSGSIDSTARVWSAEPPAALVEQVRRRAAVEIVQSLFEDRLLKSHVITALKADPTLSDPLRTAALEIAERRGEDGHGLFESAWLTILRPTSSPELNLQALHRLEAACRLVAGDPERQTEYQHALALALYRVGRSDEALQFVARLSAPPASGSSRVLPIDLAVTAMASQKLGRFADARAALDQLRTVVEKAAGSSDQAAASFLREAESVVHE